MTDEGIASSLVVEDNDFFHLKDYMVVLPAQEKKGKKRSRFLTKTKNIECLHTILIHGSLQFKLKQ